MNHHLGNPQTPVVITGGGSGIGRACAHALAAVGRPVAVWDVNDEAARKVIAECAAEYGVAVHAVGVDVTDRAAMAEAARASRTALGPAGGAVHAAGLVDRALDDVVDTTQWDRVLQVNLSAAADLVRVLVPSFRESGPGAAVVGISSIEGLLGHGLLPAYVASKHGLIGLMRSFAARLGPEAIRANAVCPGYVDTPMLANVTPERRQAMKDAVPLQRIAEPEEIASVVRFLLSEEARYVNGAAVVVDGGFTATGGQP